MVFFPMAQFWWFYLGFVIFVLLMLALDLGVFHRKAHAVSFKEASVWTLVWTSLALAFNYGLYQYSLWYFSGSDAFSHIPNFNPELQAKALALEFLTGFVVEKSLAIDNIFIFAVVFSYFGIPKMYQHRILFWGIIGALVFRGIFIAAGSVLMQYHWVLWFFGGLLILTGLKMFKAGTESQDLSKNTLIRYLGKIFKIYPKIEGPHFFKKSDGKTLVTPLFIALIFLELTDIVFAVDSVPAIFALTKEPLLVFTSNIFAILGLRSLYFMLAGSMDRFQYIKYGLAGVLIFVGLKMIWLNEAFGGKFPITWSLSIIAALIGSSVIASLIISRRKENLSKTSGSV